MEIYQQIDMAQDELDRITTAQDAAQDFTGCLNELATLPEQVREQWEAVKVWLGTHASVTLEELSALRDKEEGLLW